MITVSDLLPPGTDRSDGGEGEQRRDESAGRGSGWVGVEVGGTG